MKCEDQMKEISKQQERIINFIREFMKEYTMSPTIYEIAKHLSIKASTVSAHIAAMQKKNLLIRTAKARSIKLLCDTDNNENKQKFQPLFKHPMDLDFCIRTPYYAYVAVAARFEKYKKDICLLECNFIQERTFSIMPGDIISLIRKPESILLQSNALLLVWTQEKDYHFTFYNAREYLENPYKIIGLVMDIMHRT